MSKVNSLGMSPHLNVVPGVFKGSNKRDSSTSEIVLSTGVVYKSFDFDTRVYREVPFLVQNVLVLIKNDIYQGYLDVQKIKSQFIFDEGEVFVYDSNIPSAIESLINYISILIIPLLDSSIEYDKTQVGVIESAGFDTETLQRLYKTLEIYKTESYK